MIIGLFKTFKKFYNKSIVVLFLNPIFTDYDSQEESTCAVQLSTVYLYKNF